MLNNNKSFKSNKQKNMKFYSYQIEDILRAAIQDAGINLEEEEYNCIQSEEIIETTSDQNSNFSSSSTVSSSSCSVNSNVS